MLFVQIVLLFHCNKWNFKWLNNDRNVSLVLLYLVTAHPGFLLHAAIKGSVSERGAATLNRALLEVVLGVDFTLDANPKDKKTKNRKNGETWDSVRDYRPGLEVTSITSTRHECFRKSHPRAQV